MTLRVPGPGGLFLAALFHLSWLCPSLHADLMNGDFSSGLDGWTTEHLDSGGGTTSPSPHVQALAGDAVLETQGANSGITLVSLIQSLNIPTNAVALTFDVSFERVEVDRDDAGGGFPDFFQGSYLDSLDASFDRVLIVIDVNGPRDYTGVLTPLGGGKVRVATSLAGLRGRSGDLFFDLFEDLDGFKSRATVDNVQITMVPPSQVPEPASLALLLLAAPFAAARTRSRARRA